MALRQGYPAQNYEKQYKDRNEIDSDLKVIFLFRSREDAIDQFTEFKNKWSAKYQKPVYNMERNLGILLKYYDYPEPIRRSIHPTNILECMNKEIRMRIKIIDSLPSESAMKVIYLRVAEMNERYQGNVSGEVPSIITQHLGRYEKF